MANSFEQRPMNRSSKFDAPLIGNLNANPSNDSHTNGIINNPPTNSYNTYPNDDVHDPMHSIHSNQFYPYVIYTSNSAMNTEINSTHKHHQDT